MTDYLQALELVRSIKVVVSTIMNKDVGAFDDVSNEYLRPVITFLAELVEKIEVPEGSLSEKQQGCIVGSLLYGFQDRDQNNDKKALAGDFFAGLEQGVDVLYALIKLEQEQEFYA